LLNSDMEDGLADMEEWFNGRDDGVSLGGRRLYFYIWIIRILWY